MLEKLLVTNLRIWSHLYIAEDLFHDLRLVSIDPDDYETYPITPGEWEELTRTSYNGEEVYLRFRNE